MIGHGGSSTDGRRLRIGLFGGTFDPPHIGHLAAAQLAFETLHLDQIRFIVAADPWQKRDRRDLTKAEIRLALVNDLVGDNDHFVVSAVEIARGGPSYSIDTVFEFTSSDHGLADYFLIIGADLVSQLSTWHRADELARLVTLVVINRPGSPLATPLPPWEAVVVTYDGVDCSSSMLRSLVAHGDDVSGYLPAPVIRRISDELLYAGNQ